MSVEGKKGKVILAYSGGLGALVFRLQLDTFARIKESSLYSRHFMHPLVVD